MDHPREQLIASAQSWLDDLAVDRQHYPLHRAVSNALRTLITSGRIQTTTPLPTEPLLARHLGISRFTLRQALDTLAREGLIRREHGRGNFVTRPESPEGQDGPAGFGYERQDSGNSLVEVVSAVVTLPHASIAGLLGLSPGAAVFEVVRLRTIQQAPVAVEYLYLPRSAASALDGTELANPSVSRILLRCFGSAPTSAVQQISARPLEPAAATRLGLAPGSIGLLRHCVIQTAGHPTVVRLSFHPPERVTYVSNGQASSFAL